MLIYSSKTPLPRRFDQPEAVTGVAPCLALVQKIVNRPLPTTELQDLEQLDVEHQNAVRRNAADVLAAIG